MKNCSNKDCQQTNPQPYSNFHNQKYGDGYKSRCKSCTKQYSTKRYIENTELLKARTKEWKINNPEKAKNLHLKKYGISIDEYHVLLSQQSNSCAICKTTKPTGNSTKYFYVDHNHLTGKVRGLLCYYCNLALGMLKDNIESAYNLVAYIEKHEEKN